MDSSDATAAAAAVENVAERQFGPDFEDIHSTFHCCGGSSRSEWLYLSLTLFFATHTHAFIIIFHAKSCRMLRWQ
jgi:hypothetical protein